MYLDLGQDLLTDLLQHYRGVSVFFFFYAVRLPTELSTPICNFMGLQSNTNLPCLVNLDPSSQWCYH